MAAEKGVTLSVDIPDHTVKHLIDGFAMQRALVNLINNGIEASARGHLVTVFVKTGSQYQTIRIKDVGSGMDRETIENIFTPFYSKKSKGTGLGMPIAKKIIEGHQGKIHINSHQGQGTEITIELPTDKERSQQMNSALMQGAWKIGKIVGIPIRVHFSWLIVFGLITWSLSTCYFPNTAPDLPTASYWIKGTLAALLLFASVAFHELAHSFVAQRYKITIESITLFIFGGVAQMKGEPPNPRAKFRIAIAGLITRNGIARYVQIRGE